MKIRVPQTSQVRLLSLRELGRGNTYRDARTGNIWLCAEGGYVNLTKDHIVTRGDNMPGPDDNKYFEPRYEKIDCVLEVKGS